MKFLFSLLIFVVFFVLYVRYVEFKTVFLPSRKIEWTPAELGLAYEDVYFSASDGVKLNGWLIKSARAPGDTATMIFLHGNAGNIGDRLSKIKIFNNMNINVFIIDYRGYGRSEGSPNEKGMYLDARAAYDYLKSRGDIDHYKIIAYGVSLGGAAVVDLAVNRPLGAVIVDSTFTSAKEMARQIMPFVPAFLVKSRLDNLSKINKINAPLLIIHSVDDELIPFEFMSKLFEAAPHPKHFLRINGSHNDGFLESEEIFTQGITSFIFNLNLMDIKPNV